jgi:hypothetical protein
MTSGLKDGNQQIQLNNEIKLLHSNNLYFIAIFALGSFVILLSLLIGRWLFMIIRVKNKIKEHDAPELSDHYQGAIITNAIDIEDLIKNKLPTNYTITTNFIFTGTQWVTVSNYSDTMVKKPNLRVKPFTPEPFIHAA